MTAEIHLIHRDLKTELKSHGAPVSHDDVDWLEGLRMPKADEVLFGGPAGGSMASTTNEIGSTLTIEDLRRAKRMLLDNDEHEAPRVSEWATSDMGRVKRAIMADQTMTPMAKEELKLSPSMAFAGIPIVLDEALPSDILVEMRDQHGNSLGRVMAL